MRRLGFILMAALGLTSCLSGPLLDDSPVIKGEVSISLRQEHDMTATKADDGLPEVDDFIVEVHETATSRLFFRKTYADAHGVKIPLNAGEHRLFAYYGDPQKAGFKACYYVADTLFNVQPQQLSQIEFYNGQVSLFLSDFHSGTWTANALNEQTQEFRGQLIDGFEALCLLDKGIHIYRRCFQLLQSFHLYRN